MGLFEEELTPERELELLEQAHAEIKKRKLDFPAMMFLQLQRPLAGVTGQAAIVFAPFIVPFTGFDRLNDFGRLLKKPDNVDKLIEMLESEAVQQKKEA